jgi:hypothetical protein
MPANFVTGNYGDFRLYLLEGLLVYWLIIDDMLIHSYDAKLRTSDSPSVIYPGGDWHMPSSMIKLPGEPIVIVTIALPIERHLSSLYSIRAQIDRVAREAGGPLYVLFDLRNQDVSFSDILLGLDEQAGRPPGALTDPRVRPVGVGDHPLLAIAAKKTWQRYSIDVPIFTTLEAALQYVRAKLDREGDRPSG